MARTKPSVKPLAELIEACVGPAFAAQGFASTDILAAWPEIVGARMSRACQPVKLEWPRQARKTADDARRAESGTLVVRVEGAFALELQHLVPVVIARINAHYGWACIGRIVLKQDRLHAAGRRTAATVIDPARRVEVARAVAPIAEEALRDALDRLGQAVVAAQPVARPNRR